MSGRLAQLLRIAEPAWFAAELDAWRRLPPPRPPLEQWLALDPTSHARNERDDHLMAAWALLALAAPQPWPRAVALSAEIARYATRRWKSDQDRRAADPAWPALRAALFGAFKAGPRVPASANGLKDIVKSRGLWNSQYDGEDEA